MWKGRPILVLWGPMSIRRRSSAKVKPLDTPHEADDTPSPRGKPSATQKSKSPRASKNSRARSIRTVTLQAPARESGGDLSLEELIQLKPACVREATALEVGQATAQRVEEAKEALGKLECEVVTALFPPTGLPESVEEVAARLGMTVKEVRDVADNALRGLRGTKSSRPRLSSVWN